MAEIPTGTGDATTGINFGTITLTGVAEVPTGSGDVTITTTAGIITLTPVAEPGQPGTVTGPQTAGIITLVGVTSTPAGTGDVLLVCTPAIITLTGVAEVPFNPGGVVVTTLQDYGTPAPLRRRAAQRRVYL